MFEAPLALSCWELSRLALVATPFRLQHRFGLRSGMPSLEACPLLEVTTQGADSDLKTSDWFAMSEGYESE